MSDRKTRKRKPSMKKKTISSAKRQRGEEKEPVEEFRAGVSEIVARKMYRDHGLYAFFSHMSPADQKTLQHFSPKGLSRKQIAGLIDNTFVRSKTDEKLQQIQIELTRQSELIRELGTDLGEMESIYTLYVTYTQRRLKFQVPIEEVDDYWHDPSNPPTAVFQLSSEVKIQRHPENKEDVTFVPVVLWQVRGESSQAEHIFDGLRRNQGALFQINPRVLEILGSPTMKKLPMSLVAKIIEADIGMEYFFNVVPLLETVRKTRSRR